MTLKNQNYKTLLKLSNKKKTKQHFFDGTERRYDVTKNNRYKKVNNTSTMEHKTEHNYTLVNQTINKHKSNKEVANLETQHEKFYQ